MSYTLIEGCCGSAALTLHLCGIKKPLIPYQGSKWKYRNYLEKNLRSYGFHGKPDQVKLYDPGPWSQTLNALIKNQDLVLDVLTDYNKNDPKNVFDSLQNQKVSKDLYEFAGEFLFLQRLSFSGKAVGCKNKIWKSPGFNKTSAYGVKKTSKFGEIKPMIPSIIKVLQDIKFNQIPLVDVGLNLGYPKENVNHTVVYLDPPYHGSTKYPDGDLSRKEVVDLARAWAHAGARVIISEAEPIKELNWTNICLSSGSINQNSFKSKKEEWITISP